MARIDCHFRNDGTYITLPDEWLGDHTLRHDEAIEKLAESDIKYPPVVHNFIVAVSILDDWQLPGMPANPEKWNVRKTPNAVMVWVGQTTERSYQESFLVPKKKSEPSLNGQPNAETALTVGTLASAEMDKAPLHT